MNFDIRETKYLPNSLFVKYFTQKVQGKTIYIIFPKNINYNIKDKNNYYEQIKIGDKWLKTDTEDGTEKNYIEIMCCNHDFEDLFERIMMAYKGENIWDFFDSILCLLLPKTFNWKKWRGDVAELIFLYKFGGEKINDLSKADILLKNEYIEVKSYSPRKLMITVSHSQLVSSNRIVVVPLILDETEQDEAECYNIIEILEKIKGNASFKRKIIEQYKDVCNNSNFKVTVPKEFIKTNNLPILVDPIKDATYYIAISDKNLKIFEI